MSVSVCVLGIGPGRKPGDAVELLEERADQLFGVCLGGELIELTDDLGKGCFDVRDRAFRIVGPLALQAALVTHGAPDALVTLALTGACRIGSLEEARQLRKWLAEARTAGETDFASLHVIERAMIDFGL